jgi:hypothetical protein
VTYDDVYQMLSEEAKELTAAYNDEGYGEGEFSVDGDEEEE